MQLPLDDESQVHFKYNWLPVEGLLSPDAGDGLPLRLLDQFVLFVGHGDGSGWAAAGLEQLDRGAALASGNDVI